MPTQLMAVPTVCQQQQPTKPLESPPNSIARHGLRTMLSRRLLSRFRRVVVHRLRSRVVNRPVNQQPIPPIKHKPSETTSPLGRLITLRRLLRRRRWLDSSNLVIRMRTRMEDIHSNNRTRRNPSNRASNPASNPAKPTSIHISMTVLGLRAWDRCRVSKAGMVNQGIDSLSTGMVQVSNKEWVR
jgi:hypothetical protein